MLQLCLICLFFRTHWISILLPYSRFIETYGTHVIVGVKMGGKDVVYMKQQHSSTLQQIEVQQKLKDLADKMLIEETRHKTHNDRLNKNEKVSNISIFSCKLN